MELIETKIDEMKDDIIKSTQELIRIKSVEEEAKPGMPFGEGVNKALEYMLELSGKLGFETKNVDGYAGHAQYGEGNEIVGVLVHLDVVPEGKGWTYPPYGGEIHDGRIYGRGAIDNKGPAIAALYALKALKEAGIETKRRIRIIFGTDEESGWEGIKYYFKKEETPLCGFSPDAEYPIINSEKGIIIFKMRKEFNAESEKGITIDYIKGGTRANVVPDYCEAGLIADDSSRDGIETGFRAFVEKTGYKMELMPEGQNGFIIKSYGISAHGSLPEKGKNAICQLIMFLNTLNTIKGDASDFISFLAENIGMEFYGQSLGVGLRDEISGKLILNVGVIDFDKKEGTVEINIRYPIKYTCDDVMNRIRERTSEAGIEVIDISDNPPLYVSEDNFLVQKLKKVYEEVTGRKAELISIGGGTYARAIKNAVAFGPLFPGKPELAHEKDENIEIDDLILNAKIYAKALYELACNI